MNPHLFVIQLRFTRSEFARCLNGITAEEATRRFGTMNCLSWMVGHLATQEQYFWVYLAQGRVLHPHLYEYVGYGRPASTPGFAEMWSAWQGITQAADLFLDTLTPERLRSYLERDGERMSENIGTMLLRNIYHYWYHLGEAAAIRQQLGHRDLPEFVGDMSKAAYSPEQ